MKIFLKKKRWKQENEAINKIKNNPRAFYSYAKRFSKVKAGVGPFYDEAGDLINDDIKIADVLRNQYDSVFSKPMEEDFPNEDLFDESDEELQDDTRLTGVHFDREDIKTAIDSLSNYAAPGPDGFPAVLLKMCKHELAEPLEMIFKESLDTGKIPQGWKEAFIFPIHKGGVRSEPANYRPVSLTTPAT